VREPNAPQASRLRAAPSQLQDYIDLANTLPVPEKLSGAESKGLLPVREDWDADEADIQDLVDRFPGFREFMAGVDLQEEFPVKAARRCGLLKGIRSVLYTIARSHTGVSEGLHLSVAGVENAVSLTIDESGNLRVQLDPLLQAIDKVEARRIRECPICGKIFWAGRIDQPCCTTRCSGKRRTQLWRGNYPAKYKVQRIAKAERTDTGQAQAPVELERQKLETLKAPTIARRPARLPILRRE